jgi:CxxC motif-containing protein (DUF1111 family)
MQGVFMADGVSAKADRRGKLRRSAALWGLGQRLFFLHDGRTSDLLQAIQDHRSLLVGSQPSPIITRLFGLPSEANEVIENFLNLSASDQQAILNFLRSL